MANKSFRIRTNVTDDKTVSLKVDQDVDFLEILSLKLETKNAYKLQKSNYGIIVGRVLANDAFGIPNCKVSVFVEIDQDDRNRSEITSIYPYTSTSTKNKDNIVYNLLPDSSDDKCYRTVGTFPNKRLVLDNDTQIEIFDKYWKYTTVTNNAGDYMLYGIPTGNTIVHVNMDLSDIGVLSQSPRDFVYKGYNINQFDSPTQFRESTNLNNLAQIITQTKPVNVDSFWGDSNEGTIAISRCDVQIDYKFEPTCIFFGSVVTDDYSSNINHKCSPSINNGMNRKLATSEGTIEMIRKTPDGFVEEFAIEANKLIDSDGVWCYQIPMNLEYIGTDEFGNIVKTENPSKGIPTKTSVRFRFSLQETNNEGVSRHRAKYLVPNNPKMLDGANMPMVENGSEFNNCYEFGSSTPDEYFRDLYWNKIYSVKNHIPRVQTSKSKRTRNYSALKSTNHHDGVTPIPFNKLRIRLPFMFSLLCILAKIVIRIIHIINKRFICLLDKLRILRWYFFKIGCIGFNFVFDEDANEEETAYLPGCTCSRGQKYAKCPDEAESNKCKKIWDTEDIIDKMEQTLGENYEIANLDFYNDWLNGCLYFPLWFWKKTKKRKFLFGLITKKAKNIYCGCDRVFKKLRVTQSCAIPYKNLQKFDSKGLVLNAKDSTRNWHRDFTEFRTRYGIVKEQEVTPNGNEDKTQKLHVYYYAAGVPPIPNYTLIDGPVNYVRLYSTDIILLGSINDCNFDGLPSLYANLPITTANIPMIASVVESTTDDDVTDKDNDGDGSQNAIAFDDEANNTGSVEMSGMDWTHSGKNDGYKKGLFFDLACVKAKTRIKTCVNVERLCELGMTYDATFNNYVSNRKSLLSDEYEADGMITRHELVDNESRAMFASMNGIGLTEKAFSENTTYNTYKLKYSYPVDLDGKLSKFSNTYSRLRSHLTYDNFDASYLKFRLGERAHYYNPSFLVYENSFYFYFGAKEGSTALDKFYTKYYAECFQNNKKPFTYEYTTENARYCPNEINYDTDYALITVTLGKIKTPYSYTLYNEWGDILITEDEIYDNTLIFGAETDENGYVYDSEGNVKKDGRLVYKNPNSYSAKTYDSKFKYVGYDEKAPEFSKYTFLENGVYTLEIIDARERSASQAITISPSYITMTCSASGLGMKYYGYSEEGENKDKVNNEDYEFNVTDGAIGVEKTLVDTEDYDGEDDINTNEEEPIEGDTEALYDEPTEALLTKRSTILEGLKGGDDVQGENVNSYTDEKSLICGLDKAGTIIIDDIVIDNRHYEIIYITDRNPYTLKDDETITFFTYDANGNSAIKHELKGSDFGTDDSWKDGDFLCVVTDDSPKTPQNEWIGYVKLSIEPNNYESFSACSCDWCEETDSKHPYPHYNIGIKEASGVKGDVYASYVPDEHVTSGGIFEFGDLDVYETEDAHINFSVWRPDDYTITLNQYCYGNGKFVLSDNITYETVTVENGSRFDLTINEVPIRFLLGNSSGETDYNTDYFNPNAKYPKNLPGWFKLHLPSGYRFPSLDGDNIAIWADYVTEAQTPSGELDDEAKANIIVYKFNTMFKMANSCYVTNESLTNLATNSNGGQKPILYMGAYPNYSDIEDLSTYTVNTLGATEIIEEIPNIVGKNYRYKIQNKEGNSWTSLSLLTKNRRNNVSLYTGRLYNDLMVNFVNAEEPYFNPMYSPNFNDRTNGYISPSVFNKDVEMLGNYFAGFTLNAGLTDTDFNGACRPSLEYKNKFESYPVSAFTYRVCAGSEQTYTNNRLPKSIREHYFRAETVDRRVDYDMFIYSPPYVDNGIMIPNSDIMLATRVYGTVYNGIEMAYAKTVGVEGANKYNIIGQSKEDGLEYYYSVDDGAIYSSTNNPLISKNKRFYNSYIKSGTKKYDITDMYYSGYHTPSNIVSIDKLKELSTNGTLKGQLFDSDGALQEIYSYNLDGDVTSKFYYKNEVNGDFSLTDYPTKRTISLGGIKPANKLTFSVTSCSYDIEADILGVEEGSVNNKIVQSVDSNDTYTQESLNGEVDNVNYKVIANVAAGEETSFTIDTRDRCSIVHEFSESDLETSYDSYEIKYNTAAYGSVGGNKDNGRWKYVASDLTLNCYFNQNGLGLRLRYKMEQDGYCDTHDSFTSMPMIINVNSTTKSIEDEPVNFLNDALLNSVSPKNIVDNIRLNCRATFTSVSTLPSAISYKSGYASIIDKPLEGKFDTCIMTQTNYYSYPFLVDAENPYSEIIKDDSVEAKEVRYKYGVFSYRRKRRTKYDSDWNDYFRYGRGIKRRRKKYFYHRSITNVGGVLYERNYINTNDDNLGKNIKLIKVCNLFDLRPFKLQFLGKATTGDVSELVNDYTTTESKLGAYYFASTSDENGIYVFKGDLKESDWKGNNNLVDKDNASIDAMYTSFTNQEYEVISSKISLKSVYTNNEITFDGKTKKRYYWNNTNTFKTSDGKEITSIKLYKKGFKMVSYDIDIHGTNYPLMYKNGANDVYYDEIAKVPNSYVPTSISSEAKYVLVREWKEVSDEDSKGKDDLYVKITNEFPWVKECKADIFVEDIETKAFLIEGTTSHTVTNISYKALAMSYVKLTDIKDKLKPNTNLTKYTISTSSFRDTNFFTNTTTIKMSKVDTVDSGIFENAESVRNFGGVGGMRIRIWNPLDVLGSNYGFSLFREGEDGETLDERCNLENVLFCIDKNPRFIGSDCTFACGTGGGFKYIYINIKWPSYDSPDDADNPQYEDNEEQKPSLSDEINNYFDKRGGRVVALILKMKSGYYYTIPFRFGYGTLYRKKGGNNNRAYFWGY